jgi:hypothetical protein
VSNSLSQDTNFNFYVSIKIDLFHNRQLNTLPSKMADFNWPPSWLAFQNTNLFIDAVLLYILLYVTCLHAFKYILVNCYAIDTILKTKPSRLYKLAICLRQ